MAMKVVVDRTLCEGNARCVKLAPAVFELDDEDRLRLLVEDVPDAQREAVEAAVERCPRQALSITPHG